ncbi:MAG TPA: fibronectin type III domain-containing protein [Spirochaetota bacterium]|nr:fibronectin type III domain-containing protein [Spirochaetota bacterium]HOM37815.1 fibronectin type III domain-containing protein [Spirochaetota bacterium]HPQ49308.1 fibronectin type III domain-containing protein [Spirochaetota bacterium]
MKKKFFTILFLIGLSGNYYGLIKKITFSEDNKELFYLKNSKIENGIVIETGDKEIKSTNGKIIDFENIDEIDTNISTIDDRVFGKKSGLFYNSSNYLRFKYQNDFSEGMVIDFWIKPFSTEVGSIFSTENLSIDGNLRKIKIFFRKGKVYVKFDNIFLDSITKKNKTIELTSDKIITLKEWQHHKVIYNATIGKLEYYINNILVDEKWTTSDGNPNSPIMYLDIPSNIFYVLGKGFIGLIDNFFISNRPDNIETTLFSRENGYIYTRVIKMDELSEIYNLDINAILPKDTFVRLEYRYSLEPFSDNTPEDILKWEDYNIHKVSLNPIFKANYIQFRITLFPSPDGKFSPIIKELLIKHNPIKRPPIPLDLNLYSSREEVIIILREPTDKNIIGYKIYYGTEQNYYWGEDALEGKSPIFVSISDFEKIVGQPKIVYKLKGLQPFKVYYIRVTAINKDGVESPMSEEKSIRVRVLD